MVNNFKQNVFCVKAFFSIVKANSEELEAYYFSGHISWKTADK